MNPTSTEPRRRTDSRKPSAAALARKIRALLDDQQIVAAKEAAARGAKLFPDHKWLRQADKVLNPTRVTVVPARDRGADRRKEYDWLRNHREEYQGKWVVLLEDALIACGDSFEDVVGRARSRDFKARPLVHHVE